MTLEEAIKHARDTAENRTDLCDECRAEHKQLAEWLEQLVKLTEENERLKKILNTDISVVRVSRGSGKSEHLREVAQLRMDAVRANAVREMQKRIESRCIEGGVYPAFVKRVVEDVAKEITDGHST